MRVAFTLLVGIGTAIAICRAVWADDSDPKSSATTAEKAATDRFAKQPVPIEGDFGEGWEQTVELPSTRTTEGDTVRLWVDEGLLCARRQNAAGELDWQVILCRAEKENVPEVYVKEDVPFVEVRCNDGRYFIREIGSHLRVLREAEIDKGLFATDEVRGPEATLRGMSSSASMKMEAWDEANWFVVACGPRDDGWAVVVRLNPVDFSKRGYGFSGGGVGLTSAFHGNTQIVDDGELVVANRTLPAVYLFEKKREAARQAILSGKLPAIESAKWLNTDEPLDWDKLKGKVVLVDFWGTWCGPCVAKLPELQPLHEKYAERGLAIIAIHSANSADSCEEFIREHKFTFPVAIDSGTTAEEFAISAWPTYFLIDRAGTVVEGFNHATPTEEAIVKLIDSAVE